MDTDFQLTGDTGAAGASVPSASSKCCGYIIFVYSALCCYDTFQYLSVEIGMARLVMMQLDMIVP